MSFLKKFRENKRANMLTAAVIIGVIIGTAFALLVGTIIMSKTYDVADTLVSNTATDDANVTIEGMMDIIWPSLQLLPLQILVLVGVAIMAAVALFASRG